MNIAVIPARNGSKSIHDKNLQRLNGTRLVDRTISFAKRADFDQIYLTTDIPILLEDYADDGKVIVHFRPEELATDKALMSDVLLDVINKQNLNPQAMLWLLQPTSPFRSLIHVKEIKEKIDKYGPKAVISVSSVGANHPNRMYTAYPSKRDNIPNLYPLRDTNFLNKQDLKKNIYIRNGAFYVVHCGAFVSGKAFDPYPTTPYVMDAEQSVNIDSHLDLKYAEMLEKI